MDSAPQLIEVDLPTHRAVALAWGPADGRLVVALHGFPDTAWGWRRVAPLLAARGLRVVAPFSRGHAPTDLPADAAYHPTALVADASAWHAALEGGPDAVLLGHDWGAITANALGAHPACPYERVVSMAVPPFPAIRPGGPRLLARQATYSWYLLYHQLPWAPERTWDRLVPRLWAAWSPGYDATDDLAHFAAATPTTTHRRAALGPYRAVPRPWSVPKRYRTWLGSWTGLPRVPVLHLHGVQDRCLQPALAAGVDDAPLPAGSGLAIVPDAGHFLQLEQPDEVARRVLGFLG